jgi:tetratricopeptide (TPR) repeat protein
MNRKRRAKPNWFRIILLSLLVLGGSYVNRFILPNQAPLGVPSPTPTIAPEAFVAQGEELFKEGKLLPAIDAYRQAIISRPDDPAVHVMLARVLVFDGQYKDAQNSAEDALLLNPTNSMAHAVRAWALSFQGEHLEAESNIKRALELDPNNALAHAYYVEILVNSFNAGVGSFEGIEKAIEESKVAIALAPNTLEIHRARGIILESTGNYKEALLEFEAAAAINPNIADLHLSMGTNYRALGIYDKAVESFTRANALNPENPLPDLYMSRTYATIGEYGKAMQYAEQAVADSPADTNLRGNLGVMYYRNNYWPEAVEQFQYVVNGGFTEEGIRLDPIQLIPTIRIAEYYFTYGLALARLNQCGEALQIAQLIISRVPSDQMAVDNANAVIERCQQNLVQTPESLPASPEPDAVSTETPTP